MDKIVITGASGLLGGRLAEAFAQHAGTQVVQISRQARPGFVPLDLEDPQAVARVCSGADWVIHTAGMNAGACAADPERAAYVNGELTGKLAGIAADQGVRGLVFLSTAHVYAGPLAGHLAEDSPTLNSHPYATSNLLGERRLQEVGAATGLRTLVLRLSNGFGAPVDPKADCWMLVLNDVARQIARTGRAQLTSSGEQLRDFVPIRHITRTIAGLVAQDQAGVFNLSSGTALPVRQLVEQLCTHAAQDLGKCAADLLQAPAPSGAPQPNLTIDAAALQNLGIQPPDPKAFEAELAALWAFCNTHFKGTV